MSEFDLIARIKSRAPGHAASGVVVGIGDDAAVIAPAAGHEIVATTDSLVPGRHFTDAWSAQEIGCLAARVNLSDVAAMGARPRWSLLALTLPGVDKAWLDAFLDGFLAALEQAGTVLVGGNLARGPLNIGVQLLGEVPAGHAVLRSGGQAGDRIVVTGTPGDAAAALLLGDQAPAELLGRLRCPPARVQAGLALRDHAHAMIDLSDGFAADLGHLLSDGLGAEIDLDCLPVSAALKKSVPAPEKRWPLQLQGGSDYELLVLVPPQTDIGRLQEKAGVALTVTGTVVNGGGIRFHSSQHPVPAFSGQGWDHFKND